jgi:hypothetical protein
MNICLPTIGNRAAPNQALILRKRIVEIMDFLHHEIEE